jgi:hypothetical protein
MALITELKAQGRPGGLNRSVKLFEKTQTSKYNTLSQITTLKPRLCLKWNRGEKLKGNEQKTPKNVI